MKLHIASGVLYANGLRFSLVEAGNGRTCIPVGCAAVEVRTAIEHENFPMAWSDGHGWLGGLHGADIVVGTVMGRNGILPCRAAQRRLVALCESAAERGETVTLEVQK